MRILRGYLFRTILGTTGLVLAVLLSLGAFIEFVGQLDDIGVGDYGLLDALGWVLLQMPNDRRADAADRGAAGRAARARFTGQPQRTDRAAGRRCLAAGPGAFRAR